MVIRISILSLIILICSCTEPFDIGSFEGEDKLAVFATLTPDSLVFLSLTKTRSITSRGSNIYESSADIGITTDEGLDAKLFYRSPDESGKQNGIYINESFNPQIEKNYNLTIAVDGFEDLEGSCRIPAPVTFGDIQVDSVRIQDVVSVGQGKDKLVTVIGSFTIDVPEGSGRNYYHLASANMSFDQVLESANGDIEYIYNNEQLTNIPIENLELDNSAYTSLAQEPGFLIDDRFLDGNTSRIPFRFHFTKDLRTQEFNHFSLNLRHCDRAYFEFHRSVARQLETKDSPFSEPVVIATNIKNGIGFFSGYSTGQAIYDFPPN